MPSLDEQSETIQDQICGAALGTESWDCVLRSLERVFHARGSGLLHEWKQGGGWGVTTISPEFHQTYFAHYAGLHPLMKRTWTLPSGSVQNIPMVMPLAEYRRSEFYADWARPQGFEDMINIRIDTSTDSMTSLALAGPSSGGVFSPSDISSLRRWLVPHLRRGLRMHQHLALARADRDVFGDALDRSPRGVFVIDLAGKILFANRVGLQLLATGDALRSQHGVITAASAAGTGALHRLMAAAVAGSAPGACTLRRPGGELPVLVDALPIRSAAAFEGLPAPRLLLVATDPAQGREPSVAAVRAVFGTTESEALVAIRIAKGEGVPAVAVALGVSATTVRTHLKSVFDKTGTHRQAQLAWLLARLPT